MDQNKLLASRSAAEARAAALLVVPQGQSGLALPVGQPYSLSSPPPQLPAKSFSFFVSAPAIIPD
jgi:hypothetical protein